MAASKHGVNTGSGDPRAMIGQSTPPRSGGVSVNEGMIRLVCGAIKDDDPRYWAKGESPPGMLYAWILDLPWAPGVPSSRPSLADSVPLPGDQVINVSQHVEFHHKTRIGDRLSISETLLSVSDEKKTHLGPG